LKPLTFRHLHHPNYYACLPLNYLNSIFARRCWNWQDLSTATTRL